MRPICASCPPDTYSSSSVELGSCTQCPAGQKTGPAISGATSVSQCLCAEGQVKDATTGVCIGCASNQYSDTSRGQCVNCPSNMIAPTGPGKLEDCQCPQGYQKTDSSTCSICPIGTYSVSIGVPCAACPTGSTTAGPGQKTRKACGASRALCLPGYTFVSGGGGCYSHF